MANKRRRINHHPVIRRFAAKLREARRRLGLSQYELAMKANVAITYVGKLERAEAAPGLDMVARLAETMGLDIAQLVSDADVGRTAGADIAASELRKRIERLVHCDADEVVQALVVLVSAAEKGMRKQRK